MSDGGCAAWLPRSAPSGGGGGSSSGSLLPDRLPPTVQKHCQPSARRVERHAAQLGFAEQDFFFLNEDFELDFTGLIYIFKQDAQRPGASASNRHLHLSVHLISH